MDVHSVVRFCAMCLFMRLTGCERATSGDYPPGWEEVCDRVEKVLDGVNWEPVPGSFNWSQPVTQISCRLIRGSLYLNDFRAWSNETARIPIALKIHCADQVNSYISFPLPMKAPNLVSLEILNCRVKDWYADYLSDSMDRVQNLRILILENVITDMSYSFMSNLVANFSKVSRDVHCTSILLEKYVYKNITTIPNIKPEQLDGVMDLLAEWLRMEQLIPHKCHYKYMQIMDESNNAKTSAKHFFNQHYKAAFPELRLYNLSYMEYYIVPDEVSEWRLEYPKMQYLDLRWNKFSDFNFRDYGHVIDGVGIIDLRYNNISQLTQENMDTLAHLTSAVVNLRKNPLSCGCYVNEYLFTLLRDNPRLETIRGLGPYEYIRNMTCASPARLRGVPFWRVLEQDIFCAGEPPVAFIATVTALTVLLLVLAVLSVLVFKYRQEITILLYTRCGITFRKLTGENKAFDAFVSYSSLDNKWVLNTLVNRLENNENGPAFKLCVHHRDFEVGAAIADNVVKSVESSRYTILVLSKNFTKSEWCIYEFRTAMHQSLLEKRRHMVIIVLEDVPKSELQSDLRKCLETYTYINASDRLFWDKMFYSLSRGRRKVRNTHSGEA